MNKLRTAVIFCVAVSIMGGCSGDKQSSNVNHFERAKQYYSQNDIRASIIELKNALQKNQNDKDARLLLGRVYIDARNGTAAEKELRRALVLGVAEADVQPLMVKALIYQQKSADILKEFSGYSGQEAEIYAGLIEANLMEGRLDEALAVLNRAKKQELNDPALELASIKILLTSGKTEKASGKLEKLLDEKPNYPDAWAIMGNLQLTLGEYTKSANAFKKSIDQEALMSFFQLNSYVGLIRSYLAQQDMASAKKEIDALIQKAPEHYLPKYLLALYYFEVKNYELAKENLLTVLKVVPDHLPSQLLFGTISFALGNYEQADAYLTSYVNNVPAHIHARKLLAATRLKQSQPEAALKVLQPVASENKSDAQLLAMIGKASVQSGHLDAGSRYFRQAIKLDEKDANAIRAELAQLYLTQGDFDAAITELDLLEKTDERSANVLKVFALMKKNATKDAYELLSHLESTYAKDPVVFLAAGQVELMQGDLVKARKKFLKAVSLDSTYKPAYLELAKIAIRDGELTTASELYDRVMLLDSENVQAMLGQAQISERRGDQRLALEWLEKARTQSNNPLLPTIILANYYIRTDKVDLAEKVIEDLGQGYTDDQRILRVVVNTQLKKKQYFQAVSTFEKIVQQYPEQPKLYAELAVLKGRAGDINGAITSLESALELDSNHPIANALMSEFQLASGNTAEAVKSGKKVKSLLPESTLGDVLVGDAHLRQNDFNLAEKSYERAYNTRPTTDVVLKYAQVLSRAGKGKHANNILVKWLESHSEDHKVRAALGTRYYSQGKADDAIRELKVVLDAQPNNVIVLNNLSWFYKEKDISEAINYAKKAYELRPIPEITDTLGWLYAESGTDLNKGVSLLRQAYSERKDNADIQLHYAEALFKSGQKTEAVSVLKSLKEQGNKNALALLEKYSK